MASPLPIFLDQVSATFHHPKRADLLAVQDVSLRVKPGELLTLLGPSGCGKTTMLRMIAGFQAPSSGRILIGGEDVTRVPANRRDIGLVFQNYALFPHLGVFDNVAYGLRVKGKGADAIRTEVAGALKLVGLDALGDRQINELSGGQQQRVALARAIVIRPRVLLFDEPLSNLDAKLRVQVRAEIANLQRELGITTVYVTHDQEEAMAISDRIAVMQAGRIAQIGTAEELYRRPVSAFVASFLGRTNLIRGVVQKLVPSGVVLAIADHTVTIATKVAPAVGTQVQAVVRPEAMALADPLTGDGLAGTVLGRVYLGDKIEYTIAAANQTLHVLLSNPAEHDLHKPGQSVRVVLPTVPIQLLSGPGEP